ncbi:MAG: fibronectin type III domain-containing protein [Chitinophagales bacterium]|nr:fibronectin type III domain-containing protein [Chitinophagales bacterium]
MKKIFLLITACCGFLQTIKADQWTQKADFAGVYVLGYSAAFSINGKGYFGTGGGLKQLWEYDPNSDTWMQKADFGGEGREAAVGFAIGSKGYIGTGENGSGNRYKDFWEYDPQLNQWQQKADFSGTKRAFAFSFSIGTKGYVGGGITGTAYKGDFWEYDSQTNAWSQKADFGGGVRIGAMSFVIGEEGYVCAGRGSDYKNDLWQYDVSANGWTQRDDLPGSPRVTGIGFSIGSLGYVGLGENMGYFDDFWEYDPLLDSWTQKTDYGGTGGPACSAFVIDNKGYVGITAGNNYKEFWQYTPDCIGIIVYSDADSDGYGNINNSYFAGNCIIPSGYVSDSTDCNDADPSVHPGATEVCSNAIDDNCDGVIDENCCSIPAGLATTNITATSAQLNWNTVASATKYKLQYKRDTTDAPWITVTINAPNTSTVITNLIAGKKYKWKVRSVCGSEKSAFSPIVKFTTLLRLGSETTQASSVEVYPNPFSSSSTISFLVNENSLAVIELFDLKGTKIKTLLNEFVEAGSHEIPLDREQLNSGIYLLQMKLSEKIIVLKIVIE